VFVRTEKMLSTSLALYTNETALAVKFSCLLGVTVS
jgi:hypothetical protein